MNDLIVVGAATSPVLALRTGAVVVERRCVSPVSTVKGTGLPIGTLEGATITTPAPRRSIWG